MENIDESISEVKKYLRKLSSVIQNESQFTFLDVKILNKNRIDDIICCMEACLPPEYKKLIKFPSHKEYKSVGLYYSLKGLLFRKFIFSSSSYLIQYGVAQTHIDSFMKVMESDIKRLYAQL